MYFHVCSAVFASFSDSKGGMLKYLNMTIGNLNYISNIFSVAKVLFKQIVL